MKKLLSLLTAGLSVYAMFTVLWGANYYATPFEETVGILQHDISVEQLQQVTALFAQKVNQTALQVRRDESGVFTEDRSLLFRQSKNLYTPLEQRYPVLAAPHRAAKPMAFSYFMSVINYTGFFFPFTGEANLNVQAPACLLPATIAHELAHVRNIAPEQTANFVAVLACEASGIPAYTYSGALLAYLHLSNALYGADRARWAQVEQTLCEQARTDLDANNAYWRQFEGAAATAANTVYEGFLHSYDQTLGLKSYGAVVDLLVAYYGTT